MTKNCPKCGKQLPEDAKFCMDCGYSMDDEQSKFNSNLFSNGSIFIILIAIVLVIGGILILTSFADVDDHDNQDVGHVDLTVTEVGGWDNNDSDSKASYTLYANAIFNSVPDDIDGYNVKTSYYDSNDTEIGHDIETLENIYYESEFSISFGYYTTYKLPNPDHVTVEIIKDGKVIDTFREKVDKNSIDFLN
ncbi:MULTISPECIES: zinc ribbon domain-containing protein [unclassified Methanobrevibacter]|uniref:zinc-ribbon domain-containing protein n=1 Tax=unclassified Methanobrevibacter TaxID=2638681 RepID=UPI002736AABC|nr:MULTISPECIES: zinc ribbon domain-containing protein [unclassified Methanobrevibacter]